MFLRQTGVSYDELVELVTTKFLNPVYNDRVFFSAMGITAEEIDEMFAPVEAALDATAAWAAAEGLLA